MMTFNLKKNKSVDLPFKYNDSCGRRTSMSSAGGNLKSVVLSELQDLMDKCTRVSFIPYFYFKVWA